MTIKRKILEIKTPYFKQCPVCKDNQYYKYLAYLKKAIKHRTTCRKCHNQSKKFIDIMRVKMKGNHNAHNGIGKTISESNKEILSQKLIEHNKNFRRHLKCNVSSYELVWKDKIEKENNVKLIQQYFVQGTRPNRFVDLYDEKNNIVYEIYGKRHHATIEKDLKRQKEIEACLKCKFIVIWEDNSENARTIINDQTTQDSRKEQEEKNEQ